MQLKDGTRDYALAHVINVVLIAPLGVESGMVSVLQICPQ